MGYPLFESHVGSIFIIKMQRIEITRDLSEARNIGLSDDFCMGCPHSNLYGFERNRRIELIFQSFRFAI